MSSVAEIQNEQEYADLLVAVLPHVIHTEEENERCTLELEKLLGKSNRKTGLPRIEKDTGWRRRCGTGRGTGPKPYIRSTGSRTVRLPGRKPL